MQKFFRSNVETKFVIRMNISLIFLSSSCVCVHRKVDSLRFLLSYWTCAEKVLPVRFLHQNFDVRNFGKGGMKVKLTIIRDSWKKRNRFKVVENSAGKYLVSDYLSRLILRSRWNFISPSKPFGKFYELATCVCAVALNEYHLLF